MKKRVKGILVILAAITVIGISCVSCIRAPNYPGMVQIQTNEIAFIVDMTSDDAVVNASADVSRKDIPIPGYFVRTGRFDHQGYWRPTLKVIAVSQAPVLRTWDEKDATKTVRMVSQESAGFIVPMMINAYIADRQDATKYLAAFRPISDDNTDWSQISQRDWAPYVKENAQPLNVALDTVVYTKIMEQLNGLFVKVPILYAEVVSKVFIPAIFEGMAARDLTRLVNEAIPGDDVRITYADDVPSIRDWAKTTYGITITAMAPGDGVIFDSRDVQAAIDNLAVLSMQERTARQDRATKLEEQRVATVEAETRQRVAAIEAQTANSRQTLQRIENERLIAEATAEAIRNGKVVPTGSYPVGLTSLIITPGYNNLGGR